MDVESASTMSGGRAVAVVAALVVGLLAGFAIGFFAGHRPDAILAPRPAAQALPSPVAPVMQGEPYTDASVTDVVPDAPLDVVTPPESVADASVHQVESAPPVAAHSAPGSLLVASRPAGAQVFVDDVRVGVTPMRMAAVAPGTHRVRLELSRHRRWATSVAIDSGAHVRVGASLEQLN